jgi:DNA-binding NarL/FixJ family response regulator
VVIVDPWPIVRLGIGRILPRVSFRVVGEAGGEAEARQVCSAARPDLVIAGNHLGGEQAGVVHAAKDAGAKVLALVDRAGRQQLEALAGAGVDGILPGSVGPDDLLRAVDKVAGGDRVLDPSLVMALAGVVSAEKLSGTADLLTGREREVLACLAHGAPNNEIARQLYMSTSTVKTHLVHIYDKLGVRNRQEAMRRAAELGFLA